MKNIIVQNKGRIIVLLVALGILSIPAIAMQFTEEVDWGLEDFILMGILLLITGLGIEVVTRRVTNPNYRTAIILAILLVFFLMWLEAAVGIFNSPFAGS
jgi:hypothetical protein